MSGRILAPIVTLCVLGLASETHAALTAARATYVRDDLEVVARGSFQELSLDGCVTLGEMGAPALPVRVLRFVVPADMRVSDVLISDLDETELPGTYRVMPVQPAVPTGAEPEWAEPDPSIYTKDATYPASRVEYLGDGYLGGYRIASVAFYPLQYKPLLGALSLATSCSIELRLEPGADRSRKRERATLRSDDLYRDLVRGLVENPQDMRGVRRSVAEATDVEGQGFTPRYTPSLEGSPVEYVIVTGDAFKEQFQDFADWKTRQGMPAVVRTVSWIDSNYPGGVDTAERVRMFIQDAYESWGTTYVLLAGDTDVIPARFAKSLYSGGEMIPADIYYSCLDGDWNGDGDSDFGEGFAGGDAPGDSADFYPDVFVGRAPVNTTIEVENFITKCHTYVESPDPSFTDKDLLLAEVLFPYDWTSGAYSLDGAASILEPAMDFFPADVHLTKLYANTAEFPEADPLNAITALDSLDVGYNITFHVGHANKDILRVSTNNYLSMTDISGLSGGLDRSSFIWMLNCTTVAIDYDCIAERAINNPSGGAVSVFGSSRLEFPGTSKDYLWEWLDLFYNDSVYRAGEVCALSKAAFASPSISGSENSQRWTQLALLLLGDPALPLWSHRAEPLTVSHGGAVEVGTSSVPVTVTDAGGPVEGALVCVFKDGDVYERALTDCDGTAALTVTPDSEGSLLVTVTARNHIPNESSMVVTPATGAHVHLADFSVDDDCGAGCGNGNGYVEAGETVWLDIDANNSGVLAADGVVATLTVTDPYVSVLDDTETAGSLLPGTVLTLSDAFAVSVADSCPDEHDVTLEIGFQDAALSEWSDAVTLRIHRPDVNVLLADVNEISGDGDGIPEMGETVDVSVVLWNEGTGDANAVSGTMTAMDGSITIVDDSDSWGDIPAGAEACGATGFRYTVNLDPPCEIELELTDSAGRVWTRMLDVVPPAAPVNLDGEVNATTIRLLWNPCIAEDLWGYVVYRSLSPSGPFVRVSSAVLESGSCYVDSGLAENTCYYYYVTSVDHSGNQSAASEPLQISTNPPSQIGWPLVTGGGMYSSPALADLDEDGELEVVVASDHIYVWNADGTEILDGDGDPRTGGVFEVDGSGGYRCSPAVGELDGDPGLEIVAAAWGDVSGLDAGIYNVYAWNAEDGSVLPGWPVVTKRFCWASPVIADLDRDGRGEVAIACADGNLYCWKSDGTEFIDGDNDPSTQGVFAYLRSTWVYASTAAADLDGDHELELIQPAPNDSVYAFHADGSRVEGWPFYAVSRVRCSPSVGDVDGDGVPEVLVGSNASNFWLLRADGSVMPGWPRSVPTGGDFPPSPVLADLDGDGLLEVIVVGSFGRVKVFDYTGTALPGWPKELGAETWSSPIVADIDSDPDMEILIGCNSGKLYAFDVDGTLLNGWPIQTGAEVYGTPAVGDLDGDGDNEVVVGGMDTKVYVWDTEGAYADGDGVEWGAFLHDAWRSQDYGFDLATGVDDGLDEPLLTAYALEQNSPNPFNPTTEIGFRIPEGEGAVAHVTLTVYSVAGSVVRRLVDDTLPRGRNAVVWDGRDDAGRSVASGVYFYRLTYDGGSQGRSMVLMK